MDTVELSHEEQEHGQESRKRTTWSRMSRHLNFYRLHLLWFTILPIIVSAIVWSLDTSSNSYTNYLFLCISAITVTGLNPILMETQTHAQQALVFLLVISGNTVIVSLVTMFVRRHFFKKRFEQFARSDPRVHKQVLAEEIMRRAGEENTQSHTHLNHIKKRFFPDSNSGDTGTSRADITGSTAVGASSGIASGRIRKEMIRRVGEPVGMYPAVQDEREQDARPSPLGESPMNITTDAETPVRETARRHSMSENRLPRRYEALPRAVPIGIREPEHHPRSHHNDNEKRTLRKTATAPVRTDALQPPNTALMTGYGGFPNPLKFATNAMHRRLLSQVATEPATLTQNVTLRSAYSIGGLAASNPGRVRTVDYITFDAITGRNSRFYKLTSAQRDELGGVEYRGLNLLIVIVSAYLVLVQIIPMIIWAPIFGSSRFNWFFYGIDQGTMRGNGPWYAIFNIASGFSNAGVSLVDESMSAFGLSYAYVLTMAFMILAGNTAFPVFLRFTIWTLSKIVPRGSQLASTLQFVLDHPRRCYIYLFPAHQTRILALMVFILTAIDWLFITVLDLEKPFMQALPAAGKTLDSLFQAVSTRTAGFAIYTLSATAPAVQFLLVAMMYIAIYPVAMSIRSTNVYEEAALGIYDGPAEPDNDDIEEKYKHTGRVGTYFATHARKQLAFDIWWLAFALWIICIVEKDNIEDPNTNTYFTVFTIMFEVVSAYGTVGLSLGVPFANYSLCGEFRTISKLVLCAVMIRGRHRALPVAIDRSILLPSELDALHRVDSTRSSAHSGSHQSSASERVRATAVDLQDTLTRRMHRKSSVQIDDEPGTSSLPV